MSTFDPASTSGTARPAPPPPVLGQPHSGVPANRGPSRPFPAVTPPFPGDAKYNDASLKDYFHHFAIAEGYYVKVWVMLAREHGTHSKVLMVDETGQNSFGSIDRWNDKPITLPVELWPNGPGIRWILVDSDQKRGVRDDWYVVKGKHPDENVLINVYACSANGNAAQPDARFQVQFCKDYTTIQNHPIPLNL